MPTPDELTTLNNEIRDLETWNSWLGTIGVILLAASFISGYLALRVGRQLSEKKDKVAELDKQVLTRLQIEAANTQKDLAQAKTKQVEAELALNELKTMQAPRVLTNEQKETLTSILKISKKVPIETFYKVNADDETKYYGKQILKIFKDAGWKYTEGGLIMDINTPDITVEIPDKKRLTKPALSIINAFTKANIPFSIYEETSNQKFNPDAISIWIGIKPKYH